MQFRILLGIAYASDVDFKFHLFQQRTDTRHETNFLNDLFVRLFYVESQNSVAFHQHKELAFVILAKLSSELIEKNIAGNSLTIYPSSA